MDHSELLKKLKKDTQNFGNIIWDTLTPFERNRLLKRINKQRPEIQSKNETIKADSKAQINPVVEPKVISKPVPKETAHPKPKETVDFPKENNESKFNEWDLKTKYRVAFADMVEQRTTMMKFLLDNYGIEVVEKFFLLDNPEWAEKLKVGRMKKIFAKMISKLAPSLLMRRLSGIIVSQAQYLVGVEYVAITELTDDYEMLEITNCPVLKQFKKTIKALKFNDLEKRYICSFACVPVLAKMCAVGNCNLKADYTDKGCFLKVSLRAKESEQAEISQKTIPIKNGPS
ncbi:MAG: hypothetical protein HWN65_20965 [Candidatus Helarchaeota archaeon]|nr:hypothetical protein [Candidatus Helarchaeota archaeon]